VLRTRSSRWHQRATPQLRAAAAVHLKRALARAQSKLLANERERIADLAASVVLALDLRQPD
jgi:hypothetical protein